MNLPRGERGFVLLCVMWVVALLTVLTLGFGRRAVLDRRAATYAMDHAIAMAAARGAVQRGMLELQNKGVMTWLLPPEMRGGTHLGESWAIPKNCVEEGYFEVEEGMAGDEITYIITDEDGLIDINNAPEKLLEEVKGLNRSVLRKIIKRRTEEENKGEGVSMFQAVEELRYLRGVKDDDWFGDERNPGLKDLLTVWGDGRINVNTAPMAVLRCIPGVRSSDLEAIQYFRAGPDGQENTRDDQGFFSMDDLSKKTGVAGDTLDALGVYCKCDSGFFKITGFATRRKGRVRAVCSAVVVMQGGWFAPLDWQEKALGS